ncbi:MAG: terminase family protein [Gemmataceae bacterium]
MSPTDPPPFTGIMTHLGLAPDPWQADVLNSGHPRILLNCCRQAGKSTTVAILALVAALFKPMTKVLIVSRSHRQAKELIRQINTFHQALGDRLLERRSSEQITFTHLSRIVSVPCKEETIRGYSHIDIMILDEAARIPDDLYRAVRPMLAVSRGRLLCSPPPTANAASSGKPGPKAATLPPPRWGRAGVGGTGCEWRFQRVSVPASRPPSSKKNAAPWATPGSARNTNAPSKPSKASSTPTSTNASSMNCRLTCFAQ